MTNVEVNGAHNKIINDFWVGHRDRVPDRHDDKAWDAIQAEADKLKIDYPLMIGTISDILILLHQRMRKKEKQ